MTAFTVLAPDLDRAQTRLLRAMLTKANLPSPALIVEDWAGVQAAGAKYVLSVGKAGVDVWHEYGLVMVGAHHGTIFQHRDARMDLYTIMVLEHPGTLMQLSITGHEAKGQMLQDLYHVAVEDGPVIYRMQSCAPCRRKKESTIRPATHWEERLDMIGLCDDHFRKRAKIRKKPVKRVDKSKKEAQIPGQIEMMGGDGTKVMVSKT